MSSPSRKRGITTLLADVLRAAGRASLYLKGCSLQDFVKNPEKIDAVARNLEIIGEAVARLPDGFKKEHPEIEWSQITGLRNRIVHEYFGVSENIVWHIVSEELAPLVQQLKRIMRAETKKDGKRDEDA
jgi:uncharacterized protein with HEPN domain